MPDPGSHAYDVQRTRLRAQYDDDGTQNTNDGKADDAANAELQRDNPPVTLGDPDRAAGPRGGSGDGDGDPRAIILRSTAFTDHALIPTEAVGDGPPLEWIEVPVDAAEFAVLCEDRDAGDAVHWLAAGIPGSATGIGSATDLPRGAVAGRADDGAIGWHAPHPPVGESHRFIFQLLALDRMLGLSEGVTAEQLRAAAEGHVVAHGTLVGVVAR
jgi:Raf kinase inhibitor-like YbhB/YbcL family protein